MYSGEFAGWTHSFLWHTLWYIVLNTQTRGMERWKWRPSSTVDYFTNLKTHMPFICFYACICPHLCIHMPCTLMYLELVKKTLILGQLHFTFLHVLSLLLLTKHFHIVCLIWYPSQPVRLGRPAIASISQMKTLGLGQVILFSLAQIHSPRLLVIKPRIESRFFFFLRLWIAPWPWCVILLNLKFLHERQISSRPLDQE